MVVHDRVQTEQWAQNRTATERAKQETRQREGYRGAWSVIGIQSLACVVLLLLAVLCRLVGGTAYEGLRQGFHRALEKNELMTVVSRLWDKEPFYDLEYSDDNSVKQMDFTGRNP